MRIKKNTNSRVNAQLTVQKPSAVRASKDVSEAKKYIKCAIDALGSSAKGGNAVSRDAIANLSVILFDLK